MAILGPWSLVPFTLRSCWLNHEVCNYLKKAHSKWKKSDHTYHTMWPTGNSTPELPNSLQPSPAAGFFCILQPGGLGDGGTDRQVHVRLVGACRQPGPASAWKMTSACIQGRLCSEPYRTS